MKVSQWILLILLLAALYLAITWAAWRAQPLSNTTQRTFDVIVVLGTPSLKDGGPSPAQRERVLEGVREWRLGVAPRLIMTGGPAHNQWVEANTMTSLAERLGVPPADILEERQAQNTVQNVFYTVQIMQAHGWKSADIVSSWNHLPRAARILGHFPILWRTDAAQWPPETGWLSRAFRNWSEAQYCLKLRVFGFSPSRFMGR